MKFITIFNKIFFVNLITNYFPNLSSIQKEQLESLPSLYQSWNSKINVISRKDINFLFLKHVLHSLSIAKIIKFQPGTSVLDVGTGGGFPGIPLAILFPDTNFHLIDSIGKKIKVVESIKDKLNLKNVTTKHTRVEKIDNLYDFAVSRAVVSMPTFMEWVCLKIKKRSKHQLKNGVFCLKGGDLTEELKAFPGAKIYNLKNYFEEPFFETKKLVHLSI
tara:strand:+ start:21738 stop:22391 length:654 start_codon:yes stop_codon:yes gene_type:complete